MGSAGSESRNDESQASQLLTAALRPRERQDIPTVQDESHGSDGSLHSSNANSVHYHLNGLMPTQSQSLNDSQDLAAFGEGSQKENAPAPPEKIIRSPRRSSEGRSPHRTQAGSYPSPPSDIVATVANAKDSAGPKMTGLSSNTNKPPSTKGGKAVSFVSPTRPPARPQPPATRVTAIPANPMPPPSRRYRSLSPASQDSFAGPLPERDPIQAYIESSKAFQIPLSRLGDDSQSLSEGEDGPPPVSSNMWASRPRYRATRSPSPPGKVLVEGTPSNSSRSNDSQSQPLSQHHGHHSQVQNVDSQESSGDTQLSDLFPPGQAQTLDVDVDMALMDAAPTDTDNEELSQHARSDASTEPSSSYERLVNQDPFSPLPESTQPAHMTVDQTQVVEYSKISYEADASSILQHHDFYNDNGQVVFPTIPSGGRSARSADTTTSTTAPRGLLGLVAPHKRYRYLDIKPSTGASTQLATGDAAANTTAGQVDDLDETQIVDDSAPMISVSEETQPAHIPVVQESVQSIPPKRMLPTATRMLQNLRARLPSPRTEIVPDSEETRIVPDSDPPAPMSSSPLTDPPTAQSSPVKPRSRRGLQSEDEVLRAVTREATNPSISAVQEEEEEDEEEEVPLAATVQSAKAKGKRRMVESPEPESFAAPSPKSPKKPGFLDRGLAQKSASWRDTVIPSSDPQERCEEAEVQPRGAKPKTPVAQIAPPLPKTRSAPRQAKLAAQKRLHESSSDEDEDQDEAMPDTNDDDKDTLPADDQMDIDAPGPSSKPARGGKRKRTVSSSTRKNSNKSNGAKDEVDTPATRPTKRMKSGSSARMVPFSDATRVFALWKSDGHYYPGTVYSQKGPGRYRIDFDDDTAQDVELKFLRACRLKAGDHVIISGKTRAKVVQAPPPGVAGHQPKDEITVDLDEDGEEKAELWTLTLASRTVSAAWGDRVLAEDAVSPVVQPKVASPTPKGTPAPSESSTRAARKPLHKAGLVITSSPSNAGAAREALVTGIRRHGGVVLEDWSTLFAMEGLVDKRGQRWVLKAADIKWTGRTDVERAFLISDDNHQKPKFLIALALGIPCLSVEWVTSCISQGVEVDWQPYLLPAGFSEHLNTRVSQLVDLDWGNSIEHLKGITENLVAAKVFADMAILCVHTLFVPARGRSKKPSNPAAEAVPQIILCMGAELVEAVSDEKHASRPIDKYDYVVVREDADRAPFHNVAQHCVDVNWVKDCLTSGRLLPPPPPRPDT